MSIEVPFWFVPAAVMPSLLVAWAVAYLVRRWAPSWGLLDKPGERKVHTTSTPLGGGLAIWLAVVGPLAVGQLILWLVDSGRLDIGIVPQFARAHIDGLAQQSAALWTVVGAGTVLMLVGLADDRWGLPWQLRLGTQFAVAATCVTWQDWRLTAFIDIPGVTWLLSVLWIVALVNAFNMLDNMDGLSSGIAAIASGLLATVLLTVRAPDANGPQLFVGGFLLVLVGALVGFLWHNRPVAKLFMGDAGSYFVGFLIAVMTLLATFASYGTAAQHAVLAPLCVMAVPLYDMLTVLWIRLREGRSPFQADKSHFSHRLVELGLTKGQAVLTIYLTTATCGLGALLLHRVDAIGAGIILLMVLCVLMLIAILETTGRRNP
ncbi:MAG: undecaprenyl/decaprenyl-phosphate alpha-N-acetylglucosaminyl 1-phosphate transferase [Planctomycetes bacterium]|nr:undecaprenyl/decaprenyl-phosphate alpha-N-acetylglucosaminyl 1-phosphate transferase [Planctomycetota bacterium]